MIQALVIAMVVVVFMADSMDHGPLVDSSQGAVAGATLGGLLACWAIPAAVAWLAGRQLDKSGRVGLALRAEGWMARGRWLAVGVFGWAVLAMGWPRVIRSWMGDWILLDELVVLAPVLVVFVLGWWSLEPIERRFREARLMRDLDAGRPIFAIPTRGQAVWLSVRHQLLIGLVPLLLIMAWSEIVDRLAASGPRWVQRLLGDELASSLVTFAGVGVVFALAPMLLRRIWSTTPLGDGPLRERLEAMARRAGVGLRDILVWRTHGLTTNAAAMGLIAPVRYILLSDALLEHLQPEQVEAVAAHELAHVRHHHIAWLASSVLASASLLAVSLAWAADGWLGVDPEADGPAVVLTGVALVGALVVFGWVSRRFEWQADAFAAELLSIEQTGNPSTPITPEAIGAMAGALDRVAALSGTDHRGRSWRHGSIGLRIDRLGSLEGVPADAVAIDRQVRWIRRLAAGLVLIALGLIALDLVQSAGGWPADSQGEVPSASSD